MVRATDPSRSKQSRSLAAWFAVALTCASCCILHWELLSESTLTRQTSLLTLYDSISSALVEPTIVYKDWTKFQYHAPVDEEDDSNDSVQRHRDTVCGAAPAFHSFWNLDSTQRSRLNEDKTIYNLFFRNMERTSGKNFRYLELGAFDGVGESNTRFFDVCLGWDGLLIEPNPRVFPKLVTNRPYAHRMSYAASCSPEDEAANKTVGFWASVFTNAAQDESANRKAYASSSNTDKLLKQVPCGSLTPVVLDLFPDGHISFFSLDTEGTEHFVLKNIDFSRITFDVVIVENWNSFCSQSCASRDEARAIMRAAGYILDKKTVPKSDLYIHPRIRQGAALSASASTE